MAPDVIHTVKTFAIQAKPMERFPKRRVGFVPTMGYLHEGHLSLFQYARKDNDIVAASIFVNPAQFAEHEDFDVYPSNFERDYNYLKDQGVDAIFLPSARLRCTVLITARGWYQIVMDSLQKVALVLDFFVELLQ